MPTAIIADVTASTTNNVYITPARLAKLRHPDMQLKFMGDDPRRFSAKSFTAQDYIVTPDGKAVQGTNGPTFKVVPIEDVPHYDAHLIPGLQANPLFADPDDDEGTDATPVLTGAAGADTGD